MQMFKRIITIFVLLLFVMSVVSCGQAQKESSIKVEMVTDVGGINDQS